MKNTRQNIQLAVVIVVAALLVNTGPAHGADPDTAARKTFDNLMGAIIANDREAFVAGATDAVRMGVTPAVVAGLNKDLGARMEGGYQAAYLCELMQAGHRVHLWKLSFKDEGDDVVVRIVLKENKVAGFFLQ